LRGLSNAGELPGSDERPIFADRDCTAMSDEEFALAANVVVVAPVYTDLRFIECAVRREHNESYVLWSLMEAAREAPHAREWFRGSVFSDPRTTSRLEALSP
jgi:hypothetical protein